MNDEIKMQLTALVEFDEFKTKMLEFRKRYDDIVYDLNDKSQEKQAKSDRFSIGQVISALDKRHKEIKAPLAERVSLIDDERKRIKDELLIIQNKIKSQIEDHTNKIAEHEAMLQDKVNDILAYQRTDKFTNESSCVLKQVLDSVRFIIVDESFEHRQGEAQQAKDRAVCKFQSLYDEKVKFEKQEEELELLRKEKEERERSDAKRIFEDAQKELAKEFVKERYKNAQLEIEAGKERECKHAEELERAKQEAAEEALQKERAKVDKEQREAQEKIEAEQKAKDIEKAHIDHRKNIEEEVVYSFDQLFREYFKVKVLTNSAALQLIDAIKDGKIKHLQIIY